MTSTDAQLPTTDVLVIGAGIVGLAHAWAARRRGLSVTVVEEASAVVGASVRNFGHCCVTGQTGEFARYADTAREFWLQGASAAGYWARESGAYMAARNDAELALLEEAAGSAGPGPEAVRPVDRAGITAVLGSPRSSAVGGAYLPRDIRVDPRDAAPRLAAWLAEDQGVTFHYGTRALVVEDGVVLTTRGGLRAAHVFLCAGHGLRGVRPEVAEASGVRECALQMVLARAPEGFTIDSAVLTGTSLLRYPAFAGLAGAAAVRARFAEDSPELLEVDANVMFTRRPDGTLILGDSHMRAGTVAPFQEEATTEVLLREHAAILGVPGFSVLQRWQGVYASSDSTDLVCERLDDRTTAVTVSTGIGMTISHGLAEENLSQLR
ncbi:TIGR03364 family FAD-dependent oxidoreductase [Brevibacterium litoralis]|uniref:TIGR03364 family FAD-dependent oxidoreductase n=1 Tax=Brevibacterium litoralis TaxID=3138935 RepID=UPI0032EE8F4A